MKMRRISRKELEAKLRTFYVYRVHDPIDTDEDIYEVTE